MRCQRLARMFAVAVVAAWVVAGPCVPLAAAEPEQRTYALVAAIGDQFNVVYEVKQVGSRLEPYRRTWIPAVEGYFGGLALDALDKAIAKADPDSRRIFLSVTAANVDDVPPARRGSVAIERVIRQLEHAADRPGWHRIVVLTPAFQQSNADGLAPKLHGFGLFMEPLGRDAIHGIQRDTTAASSPTTGEDVISDVFVAPFAYVEVWVLDPKTMTVLDRQKVLQSHKLHDPMSPSVMLNQHLSPEQFAVQMHDVVVGSVATAVSRSEVALKRGHVEMIGPTPTSEGPAR